MTVLIPVPKFRAFSNDGLPLDGGLVYTYAAGTSTPLATYTDSTGNSANTNPVVLDAAGYADIWLGNFLYKIVLQDANGVVIYTEDNIGTVTTSGDTGAGFGEATDIASGVQVDLGTITSHFANITGTAGPIASFGSTASLDAPLYLVKFASTPTITASGNILTPTGTDITVVAQDHAWLEYLGSGAWRIFNYMPANGLVNLANVTGVLGIANGGTGGGSLFAAQSNLAIYQHIQSFTSSGTFTPAANVTRVFVEVWGGGGGGGGAANGLSSPGGGGGGYAAGYINVTPAVAFTVTVGAAGTAGASTPAAGGNGGTSSFAGAGVTFTATGGTGGGLANTIGTDYTGGVGGTGTNGDINITGEQGGSSGVQAGTPNSTAGKGGDSPRGGAGGAAGTYGNASTTGFDGMAPGGGGGGANGVAAAKAGGAGGAGLVIVYYT